MITNGAQNPFPSPSPAPLQYICDQCNGCEGTDVDAPMFFGAEPADVNNNGIADDVNYVTGGLLADVNKSTMARAVFDNIIVKNNRERRTDWTGAKNYEDRFFETYVQSTIAKTTPSGAPHNASSQPNFGAVYRRGLIELSGGRYRLGSLSWTAYPSTYEVDELPSDANLHFEVDLLRLPGGDGNANERARFRSGFPSIGEASTFGTDARVYAPENAINGATVAVEPYTAFQGRRRVETGWETYVVDSTPDDKVGTSPIGYGFAGEAIFDATGDPTPDRASGEPIFPLEILVLEVQLKDKGAARGGSGLPQPIVETPVLEDVTLTLIRESPQVLYAQEGVEE